jgi:hypothetical protein
MPYIVIVNMPGCLPEQDPHAYATLDDDGARDAALEEVVRALDASGYDPDAEGGTAHPLVQEVNALTERGGVIGPLPDGYVIDVQCVTWHALVEPVAALGWVDPLVPDSDKERADILDAYNAQ